MSEDSDIDPPSVPTAKGVGDALVEGLPFSVGSTIAGYLQVKRGERRHGSNIEPQCE